MRLFICTVFCFLITAITLSMLYWHERNFGLGPETKYLQVTTHIFDTSVTELLAPLAFGGTVVMAPPGAGEERVAPHADVRVAVLHPLARRDRHVHDAGIISHLLLRRRQLARR